MKGGNSRKKVGNHCPNESSYNPSHERFGLQLLLFHHSITHVTIRMKQL